MADISSIADENIQLKRPREESCEDQTEGTSHQDSMDTTADGSHPKKLKTKESDDDLLGNPSVAEGISSDKMHALDSENSELPHKNNGHAESEEPGSETKEKIEPDHEVIELNSDSDNDEPSTSGIGPDGVMTINDDDDDDNISDISGVSDVSIEEMRWTSNSATGPVAWIQRQISNEVDPRMVLRELVSKDTVIPDELDDFTLWKAVLNMLMDPPKRKKLPNVNTLEDAIDLIKASSKIMVLTGAGVSVSCGIPDFRSKDGIYSRLAVEYPDLPDPQAMFDIHYFTQNQKPFFKFAKEIYPGQFEPSLSHRFIKLIEDNEKLLRNYTQNIDTLEQVAGISNVIQCHGSFVNATCMICRYKVDHKVIEEDIMNQIVPRCPNCPETEPLAIMKPDIVFFGESLPAHFHRQMEKDKNECDLLIVMGSSLKVKPVALIPNALPANIPQILINREPIKHQNYDIELLGNCDDIVQELCHRLGENWTSLCQTEGPSEQITRDEMPTPPRVETPLVTTSVSRSVNEKQESSDLVTSSEDAHNKHPAEEKNATKGTSEQKNDVEDKPSEETTHSSDKELSSSVHESGELSQDKLGNVMASLNQDKVQGDIQETVSDVKQIASTSEVTRFESDNKQQMEGKEKISSTDQTVDSSSNKDENKLEKGDGDACNVGSMDDKKNLSETIVDEQKCSSSGDNSDDVVMIDGEESTSGVKVSSTENEDGVPTMSAKELEEMRACWKPRFVNLAVQLKDNTFLFLPPNRYIFKGADFLQDLDEVSEYSSASHISIGDSSDEEEHAEDRHKANADTMDNVTSGIDSTAESDDVTTTGSVLPIAKDSGNENVIDSDSILAETNDINELHNNGVTDSKGTVETVDKVNCNKDAQIDSSVDSNVGKEVDTPAITTTESEKAE